MFTDSVEESLDDSCISEGPLFEEGVLGTRPALPENLGPDYEKVVEIFTACTENNPEIRPSAKDLVNLIDTLNL